MGEVGVTLKIATAKIGIKQKQDILDHFLQRTICGNWLKMRGRWHRYGAARVDHLVELGSVGDVDAFGLVHVLAGHGVAVVLGVIPRRRTDPRPSGRRRPGRTGPSVLGVALVASCLPPLSYPRVLFAAKRRSPLWELGS
jgi:hypothetical protein